MITNHHNLNSLLKHRISLSLCLLLLAAMACSIPGLASTPAAVTPTVQAVSISTDLTATVRAPGATPTLAAPPEPPAYGMDLFQKNIESKKWTEGQGLVLMMEYTTGQKTAGEVFGDQAVQDTEATELAASVDAYLAQHPDAPETAQLTQLMAILRPDPENLEKYAAPDKSAMIPGDIVPVSFKQPAPAFAPSGDEDCGKLWAGGFPTPQPGGTPPVCLLYKTFQVLGKTYRIFYPKDLSGSAATPANIEWATEALTLAAQTYKTIGGNTVPGTDLVYGVMPSITAAAMASLSADGKCHIYAYPKIGALSEAWFRQVIAHESFHCYQASFMKKAYSAPHDLKKWWSEGSAEYFSNLVYPLANEEYSHIPSLDSLSNTTAIFDMSYQNAFFFLFMAGKTGGPAGVLNILEGFPASGARDDYAAALAKKIPDFQVFFQEFGHAYLDATLQDTGGGAVPFNPKTGNLVTVQGSGSLPLAANPFMLTRYALNYSNGVINQTINSTGKGLGDARLRSTPGAWEALPAEVIAKCAEQDYIYLVTTVTPGAPYISTINFTTDPKDTECDKCLFGKWNLDSASFSNYMTAALPSTLKGVVGSANLTLTFTKDGSMDVNYDPLEVEFTVEQPDVNNKTMETTIDLNISGFSSADFSTQAGVIYLSNSHPNLQIDTMLNGQKIDSSALDASKIGVWNAFAPVDQYTCSGDALSLTPKLDKVVPALLFTREK
jgi:hypothetical protein